MAFVYCTKWATLRREMCAAERLKKLREKSWNVACKLCANEIHED